MKKRTISMILTVALLFSLVTFVSMERAFASDGAYVLVGTEYRVSGSGAWEESPTLPMEAEDGRGTISGETRSATIKTWPVTDPSRDIHTRWSWSAPPQRIEMGDTVAINVDVEVLANNDPSGGGGHYFYLSSVHGTAGGDFDVVSPSNVEDPTYYLRYFANGNGNVTQSGSYTFERTFSYGNRGWGSGVTEILVTITRGSQPIGYDVKYIYEWQESAAPAPEPEPEPAPAPQPEPQPEPAPAPAPPVSDSTQTEATEAGNRMEWPTVSGALGYRIFRSTNPNELGISVTDFFITALPFVDVNIQPNTDYYYTVKPVLREANPLQGVDEELGDAIATYTVRSSNAVISSAAQQNFILLTINQPQMIVNGQRAEIDPGRGTVPIITSGRTLVPIRAIVEAMGGTVGWDGTERKITLNAQGNNVEMWLNSTRLVANGAEDNMDIEPAVIEGRTFVPVRFSAENLDAQTHWITSTQEVVIVY